MTNFQRGAARSRDRNLFGELNFPMGSSSQLVQQRRNIRRVVGKSRENLVIRVRTVRMIIVLRNGGVRIALFTLAYGRKYRVTCIYEGERSVERATGGIRSIACVRLQRRGEAESSKHVIKGETNFDLREWMNYRYVRFVISFRSWNGIWECWVTYRDIVAVRMIQFLCPGNVFHLIIKIERMNRWVSVDCSFALGYICNYIIIN